MADFGATEKEVEKIDVPTVHLHGLRDANLENGRNQIRTYFEAKTTTLVEIDYHHAMPWKEQDLIKFSASVKNLSRCP